jgi:2,3-bisphosphoglycerate-dependent phosphoglycerate mutase
MKTCNIFLVLLLAALACSQPRLPTTFILLRHAEKANDGTDDPDLKPEGVDRAERLKELLRYEHIDGIYSTEFKRTRQTVEQLAVEKKLDVQLYEPFKDDQIENILEKHEGGTVVICGHTNNIPWTANTLIGSAEFKDYEESEYGIFLVVTVLDKGKNAKVLRLSY